MIAEKAAKVVEASAGIPTVNVEAAADEKCQN